MVPVAAVLHLRRNRHDKTVLQTVRKAPAELQMSHQRLRLILGENVDRVNAGIDKVRQNEVDYSVLATKLDGKFRAIEVRVNRPDAKVRARRGYYARGPGS